MNKYYTPTLEEMCVGFECEINKKTQSENTYTETWEPIVIDAGILTSILNIETQGYGFPLTGFRVKVLDNSDIEEIFGIENITFFDNYGSIFSYIVKADYIDFFYEIRYDTTTNLMTIEYCKHSNTPARLLFANLFQGYIKNKSELAKLLQQLRIKLK